MIVVDSSAWIEWLANSIHAERIAEHLPKKSEWLVPTMVQLELAKWLRRENVEDWTDHVIAFTWGCHVIPLNTIISLGAAGASRVHQLPTADAIIYATARAFGAQILTCDAHFKGLSAVIHISKVN